MDNSPIALVYSTRPLELVLVQFSYSIFFLGSLGNKRQIRILPIDSDFHLYLRGCLVNSLIIINLKNLGLSADLFSRSYSYSYLHCHFSLFIYYLAVILS